MSKQTTISWCDNTWNPVVGCRKISPGCDNCTAERALSRLKGRKLDDYANGFEPTETHERLHIPFNWKNPQIVLVNSLSDIFLEEISLSYLNKMMQVMQETPRHKYVLVTKRMTNLALMANQLIWPDNLVLGTSIESHEYLYRMDILKTLPPKLKFVSFQPLLDAVYVPDFTGIDWVTCESEAGMRARKTDFTWIVSIRDACKISNVPFQYAANCFVEEPIRKMIWGLET